MIARACIKLIGTGKLWLIRAGLKYGWSEFVGAFS